MRSRKMASLAAGRSPVPSLTAWKAARVLNGEVRRPSPFATWLLSTNQIIPVTLRVRVRTGEQAVGVPVSHTLNLTVSAPSLPALGLKV